MMTYEEANILISSLYYSLAVNRITSEEFAIALAAINRIYE